MSQRLTADYDPHHHHHHHPRLRLFNILPWLKLIILRSCRHTVSLDTALVIIIIINTISIICKTECPYSQSNVH